jgi:hypothetical protein
LRGLAVVIPLLVADREAQKSGEELRLAREARFLEDPSPIRVQRGNTTAELVGRLLAGKTA